MAVRTISAAVAATMGGQSYGQAVYTIQETSEPTGASAVRVLGPPRWVMGLRSQQGLSLANAGAWEALLLRLRGGINHLAVYDFLRPAPLGTMRGSPTVSATTVVGSNTIPLASAGAGATLLPGDWLQIGSGVGSHLIKVVVAATADGAGAVTVTFEPPLRAEVSSGTAVAWDKALGHYKMRNDSLSWSARANGPAIDGFSVDLLEDWGT